MQEATTDGSKAARRSYRAKPAALVKRQPEREPLTKSLAVASLGGCRCQANQEKENLRVLLFLTTISNLFILSSCLKYSN